MEGGYPVSENQPAGPVAGFPRSSDQTRHHSNEVVRVAKVIRFKHRFLLKEE